MSAKRSGNLDSIRHAKRALYLVAALYVSVGLLLAGLSAVRGDPLGTFLGFLIVSGGLGAAVVLAFVLRISAQSELLTQRIEEQAVALARLERFLAEHAAPFEPGEDGSVRNLDLTGIGTGDPALLAAATLDRAVYPRLVPTMEEEPPADSVEQEAEASLYEFGDSGEGERKDAGPSDAAEQGESPATKNLLRQWRLALREGDLASCRAVFSALVDTSAPEQLLPLRQQLEAISTDVERRLRDRFSQLVRDRDFAGALATGEEICRLLPDRPVAEEFRRLAPHLVVRAGSRASSSPRQKTAN